LSTFRPSNFVENKVGAENATVIDHAGCVSRHGFAEDHVDWTLNPDSRAARNRTHEQRDDSAINSRLLECSNCSAIRTAGKPCLHCGFVPETRPRYVHTADGELGLIDRERRVAPHEWSHDQRLDFYGQLVAIARERGYKAGWAACKYRDKFNQWPPWPRGFSPPPVEPTPEVRRWVKSRIIAWAKSQARRAA
jgi:DNA repair protein RadD